MVHSYRVTNSRRLTRDTFLIDLEPKRPRDRLRFYSGQYAALGFKRFGRPSPMRCFSIVSSPTDPDTLQFAIKRYGTFTKALSLLQPGDTVFVRGPFGKFVIDEDYDKNILLLAAGIGITPFMSMIRYATDAKLPMPITLLYSTPRREDIPFLDELRQHEQHNPRFKAHFFLTQEPVPADFAGHATAGRLNEARLKQVTGGQYSRFTYFMCGPKGFVQAIRHSLESHHVDPHRMVTEEFTPAVDAQIGGASMQRLIPRWTYGAAGASLVLAVLFFMVLDLDQTLPKLTKAQAAAQSTTGANTAVSTTPTTATSPDASSSSTSNSQTPTIYTQTYQTPMTSVS